MGGEGGARLARPGTGQDADTARLCEHTALMARHPGSRLGPLLLLAYCLAAAQANLLNLNWLWSTGTDGPTAGLVSESPGSPHVQPREDTTTHVALQHGPTEQGRAPASSELPVERLETSQGRASATGPDLKEENIAGVGAKILNVAQGIRSFVQLWDDSTPTTNSPGAETAAPTTPTAPLTLPGPSSPPPENGTALWLGSGTLSSWGSQRIEAGTQPVPTQPPHFPGGPSVPPPSPGRAALSSAPGGAPPWGSQWSPGRPRDLDSGGLPATAARPGQQHQLPDILRRTPHLLPLVTGPLGALAAPSALSSGPPTLVSRIPLSAITGDRGAWSAPVADSVGPGLANNSALLGADPLTPAGQPVHAAGRCLPLSPSLPVCSHLGIRHSWLPNHLHHGTSEEVRAAARAWGGLLQTHCHRFLAWFFCLLLAPPCGARPPPAPPPCRQFCEALEDACWSHLDGGGLPVTCASLPAQEDGFCVFIGPGAGNWQALPPALSLCPAR